MSVVILFDDERTFVPGFRDDAIVVRNVAAAEDLFTSLKGTVVDELWFDYILMPGDTTEAIHALEGVTINKILFHSSASMAKELVEYYLKKVGIETAVEVHGREVFLPER